MFKFICSVFIALSFMVTGTALASSTHHRRARVKTAVTQQVGSAVNINSADASALETLNGLGPKKAEAIVNYREKHGKFNSLEDLTAVRGIGSKFIARLEKRNPGKIVVK